MGLRSTLALALCALVLASVAGCASSAATGSVSTDAKGEAASGPVATQQPGAVQQPGTIPAPQPSAAPAVPGAPAVATAPAVLTPWWTKPAPAMPGKQSYVAQADGVDASAARRAAVEAGKSKLQALGADVSRLEIIDSTITRVRFDGPFRAFVLVAAPKAN